MEQNPFVLVVEDDPTISHLLRIILTRAGMQSEQTTDGAEALAAIEQYTPDLIISDIMMPNMDGYALRKALLENEETKLIPFMFLTAKDQKEDIIQGMHLDVDDYILKPFEPELLIAKVEAILRRYRQFNELLRFDTLTNVFNRRTLESSLQAELNRVKRYKQSVSILMLDLDHFKKINDTYGHNFGDVVLKSVCHASKDNLRDIDFIGRIGGEEFVVVMPSTNKTTALFVADRLREQISNLNFDGKSGLRITISGGVAEAPVDGTEIDELLKKADKALYAAKHQGRNMVVAAE